jgi:hypothetical protein
MELNLREYTTKVDELNTYVHKIVSPSLPSYSLPYIFPFF